MNSDTKAYLGPYLKCKAKRVLVPTAKKFCPNCGECGKFGMPVGKFCGNCGLEIETRTVDVESTTSGQIITFARRLPRDMRLCIVLESCSGDGFIYIVRESDDVDNGTTAWPVESLIESELAGFEQDFREQIGQIADLCESTQLQFGLVIFED